MAKTLPFVSSMRTIRQIQATDHAPLKANTKFGKRLQALFPDYDPKSDREKSDEVRLYYLPQITHLSDADLLAELDYWARKFARRNEAEYSAGTPIGDFLCKAKSLQRKIRQGLHPEKLTYLYRQTVIKGCIALRWQLVPYFPGPSISGESRTKGDHHKYFLYTDTDWQLAQRLASLVGSCEIVPHELSFMARSWRSAWNDGPEKFRFESAGHRKWAERLHHSLLERETFISYEQVQRFKEMVGFLTRVPLWRRNPVQVNLEILPHAVIVPKMEEAIVEPVIRPADLGDLLSVPTLGVWVGPHFQYSLFDIPREEIPWNGKAVQSEIRF